MSSAGNQARGTPRPQAPTPDAVERGRLFRLALAAYIGLAPDDPLLPALAAIVSSLLLPALDVLGHGYGDLTIEIAGHWPARVQRTKSDRVEPPPREYRAAG